MKVYFYSIEVYDDYGVLKSKQDGTFDSYSNIRNSNDIKKLQNDLIDRLELKIDKIVFIAFNAV